MVAPVVAAAAISAGSALADKLFNKKKPVKLEVDENILAGMNIIDRTTGREYKKVKNADGTTTVVEQYAARGTPEEQAMVERGRQVQKNALDNIYSLTSKVPGSEGQYSPYIQAYINLGKQNITDSYAASLQAQGNALGTRGLGGGGSYSQGAKAALDAEYGKALQANYWDSILKGTALEGQAIQNQQNAYNFGENVVDPARAGNLSQSQAGIAQGNATLGLNSAIAKQNASAMQPPSITEELLKVGAQSLGGYLGGDKSGGAAAGATQAPPAAANTGSYGNPIYPGGFNMIDESKPRWKIL